MERSRAVVYATVAIVLLATLLSGPLVGAVDFTREREAGEPAPGTGDATVTVLDVPSTARLAQGRYGSGTYYLRVPDATVDVGSVEGQPMLAYRIRIPALGYTRVTTHFLDERHVGRRDVELATGEIEPDAVDRDRYDGELVLLVRGDRERRIHRSNVTVEVRRR